MIRYFISVFLTLYVSYLALVIRLKSKIMKYLTSLLLFICLLASQGIAQTTITLHADEGEYTISRHIYGHFSEHLGHCIYGGFYVGEDNKMIPNQRGIRTDVVNALKELEIPNLRWPGGCFADTYHWKDGIGPKSDRPKIVNTWWGGVTEDNSFGTHEFLDLCEQLGTEPFISGNVGSGTVQELSDWVQYINFNGESPMSELRKTNGREEPWKVKYWGVGNEAWGCGGNMRVEHYVDVYRKYATFMNARWGDERIFRIASGPSDDNYHWTEVLMRDIPHQLMQGIGMHHYSVINWNKKSSATEFSEEEYAVTMQKAYDMERIIRGHSAVMDQYDADRRVALVVDEWGGWYDVEPGTNPGFLFQQNTMRDAMIAGMTLNIFNNHADRVRMANLAQTVNVLQAVVLTDGEKMLLTPTYYVMDMYKAHHDATLIPAKIHTVDYTLEGKSIPAVSVSASKKENGTLTISLVNVDSRSAQPVSIDLRGMHAQGVQGQILQAAKLQAHNTFDQPEGVHPANYNGAKLDGDQITLTMPPFSVIVLSVR